MCTMASDDDSYVLDADGNRILIGLTLDETREFECLDELISNLSSVPTDDSRSQNEGGLAADAEPPSRIVDGRV